MQDIDFSKRTKADLVNLVRLSRIMPVSRAQRMPKAELIAELQRLTAEASASTETNQAEIIERAAPGRAAASRQLEEDQRQRKSRRRSVLMPVSNGDIPEGTVSESRTISVMETPPAAEEEAPPAAAAAAEGDGEAATAARPRKRTAKRATAKKTAEKAEPSAPAETAEEEEEAKRPGRRQTARSKKDEPDSVAESEQEGPEAAEKEEEPAVVAADAAAETAEEGEAGDASDAGEERQSRYKRRKQRQDRRDGRTDTGARDEKDGSQRAARSIDSGEEVTGVLEIMPDGYGFLRRENYIQGPRDVYVPPQFIRRFQLRPGDLISGPVRNQRENDRYQAIYFIKTVNDLPPDQMMRRPHFDKLTPIHPNERFNLETTRNEFSTRIIDLIAPIGKGQRGMIVSPPKAGKTILLQKIANAISINSPKARLIVLLIDERPEEVTDMQRSITGEVVYSTFDKTPENHVKITELVLERAMRLVELRTSSFCLTASRACPAPTT